VRLEEDKLCLLDIVGVRAFVIVPAKVAVAICYPKSRVVGRRTLVKPRSAIGVRTTFVKRYQVEPLEGDGRAGQGQCDEQAGQETAPVTRVMRRWA
jgi:hypothetical protein